MANIKVNDLISSEIELLSSEEVMDIEASIRELSEEELNISGGGHCKHYGGDDDDDDGGKHRRKKPSQKTLWRWR